MERCLSCDVWNPQDTLLVVSGVREFTEVGFSLLNITPYIYGIGYTAIPAQQLAQNIQHLSDGWYTTCQSWQEREAEIN